MNWGKPGVHFDWEIESEPWNSSVIARKEEDIPEGYPKKGGWMGGYLQYTPDFVKFIFFKKKYDWAVKYAWEGTKCEAMILVDYRYDLFNETNAGEVRYRVGETLDTIRDEFYYKEITGALYIDAEWDSYVAKWRKSGGDEWLAAMNRAPILSELRKGNRVY